MKPCPECGSALQNKVVECPDCGASLERASQPVPHVPNPEQLNDQRSEERWTLIRYSIGPVVLGIIVAIGAISAWGPAGVLVGVAAGAVAFMVCLGIDMI